MISIRNIVLPDKVQKQGLQQVFVGLKFGHDFITSPPLPISSRFHSASLSPHAAYRLAWKLDWVRRNDLDSDSRASTSRPFSNLNPNFGGRRFAWQYFSSMLKSNFREVSWCFILRLIPYEKRIVVSLMLDAKISRIQKQNPLVWSVNIDSGDGRWYASWRASKKIGRATEAA